MATYGEFREQTQAIAKAMRKLPKDLRRDIAKVVKEEIATPIADEINKQAHGPYGRALSSAAKARLDAQPVIVVGGTKSVVSGGATGRQLVFGTEFGGGNRTSVVKASRRAKSYRRKSTKQFSNPAPYVYPTVEAKADEAVEKFAEIVLQKLDEGLPD